ALSAAPAPAGGPPPPHPPPTPPPRRPPPPPPPPPPHSLLVQGHALVGDAGFHEGWAFGAEARLAIELDCVGLGFEEYLRVVALAGGLYGSV
ncbi:MAG: hypothetical protein F4Y26_01700, partial [Gammaproteobacteria bacterium]|nr:hypothetical protein [Gammaproteobacteria bacterium]